jgi:hypothetical protein
MTSFKSANLKLIQALLLVGLNSGCNNRKADQNSVKQPVKANAENEAKPQGGMSLEKKARPEVSDSSTPTNEQKNPSPVTLPAKPDSPLTSASESQARQQRQASLPAGNAEEPQAKPEAPASAPPPASAASKETGKPESLASVGTLKEVNDRVAQSEQKSGELDANELKKWQALLDWVADKAQTDTSAQSRETFLFIEEATPEDREKDHVNRGISLVGGLSQSGQFGFSRVQMLVENWTYNEKEEIKGIFHHFVLDRNGKLVLVMNKELLKTKAGRVLKDQGLDVTAEENQKILEELKQYWFKRAESAQASKK